MANLNEHVGEGFGDNGDQYTCYELVDGPVGPSQGAPSASACFHTDDEGTPILAESWHFPGANGRCTVSTLSMTVDFHNRGTFTYDNVSRRVVFSDWASAKSRPAIEAATRLGRKLSYHTPALQPGSLTAPFANPSLSIAALAERSIAIIIRDGG